LLKAVNRDRLQLAKRGKKLYGLAEERFLNDVTKSPRKRERPRRRKPIPADMGWVGRLEPLDADAAAALGRPGPEYWEQRDAAQECL
jgi:hypothetical protein